MYPIINLAIDNCFASKRWTRPEEWMEVIRALGLRYVECSADTECDPLYLGEDYLRRWIAEVGEAGRKYGVTPANLYSGHGTYATLGLSHTDPEVRSRFLHAWLEKMTDTAAAVGAGLGFFCHAFPDAVLQRPALYDSYLSELTDNLGAVASYAAARGAKPAAVEQMYSPHQVPWTIEGGFSLLREIFRRSGAPFYLTVDVGHQTGQRKFLRPTEAHLLEQLRAWDEGSFVPELWVGPQSAVALFEDRSLPRGRRAREILDEMDRFPYLFAEERDGSPYEWLRRLGCYSPIVHLQQTDGLSSAHRPFTAAWNKTGIIEPCAVLGALAESYRCEAPAGMPPRVSEITLTLEIFTGTAAVNRAQLEEIRQSIAYWREAIPQDGLTLDRLV